MTISDLAFERGVSRQSVQVSMNDLVEIDYIELEDNPRHKRSKLLKVTLLGREKFEAAQQVEYGIIQQLFFDLPAADVEATSRVLCMLQKNLGKNRSRKL